MNTLDGIPFSDEPYGFDNVRYTYSEQDISHTFANPWPMDRLGVDGDESDEA